MVSVNNDVPLVQPGYATDPMLRAIAQLIADQQRALVACLRHEARLAGQRGDRRQQQKLAFLALEIDISLTHGAA